MSPSKAAVLVLAVTFILSSGVAEAQRRVFTNDDLPAPPPPPAAAEPAEAAPAAAVEASAAGEAAPPAAEPASGLEVDLKESETLQAALRHSFNAISEKISIEADPGLRQRWIRMADCMSDIIQNNQRTIGELEAQIKEQKEAEAAAQPQAAAQPPAQSRPAPSAP